LTQETQSTGDLRSHCRRLGRALATCSNWEPRDNMPSQLAWAGRVIGGCRGRWRRRRGWPMGG